MRGIIAVIRLPGDCLVWLPSKVRERERVGRERVGREMAMKSYISRQYLERHWGLFRIY